MSISDKTRDAVRRVRSGIRIQIGADHGEYSVLLSTLIQALESGGVRAVDRVYQALRRANPEIDGQSDTVLLDWHEPDMARLDAYEYTDLGQAEALADMFRDRVRSVPGIGWMVWDGTRWHVDEARQLWNLTGMLARARIAAVALREINYDDENAVARQKRDMRYALAGPSYRKLRDISDLASTQPQIISSAEAFDSDPDLLNVANGILDLRRGVLMPHQSDMLMSEIVDVPYYAEAPARRWERFVSEIFDGDRELTAYLQRAIGYTLTGHTTEQKFWMLHGTGANGKSVLQAVLRELLGSYSKVTPFNTLAAGRESATGQDLVRLRGTRLVTSAETADNTRLNEERIKAVTGGDRVSGRFLYQKTEIEFNPQFKLWLSVNHRPTIRGTDRGIWRRVVLFPFEVSFEANPQRDLLDELRLELPGILAWSVRGAQMWYGQGLSTPARIVAATAEYEEEMDMLGGFIEDCCVIAPGASVASKALYDTYAEWANENGVKPQSNKWFSMRIAERYEKKRSSGGFIFNGIGIRYDGSEGEGV